MPEFYRQQTIRAGVGGLDLRRSRDLVDTLNATILTNAIRTPDGAWTSRLGQTSLATGPTKFHSIRRLDDPHNSTHTRIWGGDTSIYAGFSGALGAAISTGYSGNPVSLVPWQTTLTGDSWMLVADSNKMVKVRASDSLVLPIGLSIPSAAVTTALASENKKVIDAIDDATTYAAHAGVAAGGGAPSAPTLTTVAHTGAGNCVKMVTVVNTAIGAYSSYADKTLNLDLTTYGAVTSPEDDYIHLYVRTDTPATLAEMRIYLISNAFTAATIPGTSATINNEGYYKSFRAADISPALTSTTSSQAVLPIVVAQDQNTDAAKNPQTMDGDSTTTPDPTSNEAAPSTAQLAGVGSWTEFGSVGLPLRKSDFQAFGTAPSWASIKGIAIMVITTTNSTGVTCYFDDCYLTGGSGPDTGEPGLQKYDYVATNYDPRTGGESNASAEQATTAYLDALRRSITITPAAASDSNWRQRLYRRGGTLVDNWLRVGVNTSNGGAFTDTANDTSIADADTPPTDNFAAVPTVNSSGTTVLAQAVPYMWGPVQGIVFAAGDPYRPGSVYFCKPDNIDAWGANDYVNVCSPSEAIIGGFTLGSNAFAWSTQRLYDLYVNLSDSGSVSSGPTNCTRAPAAPWAFTVGQGVCWFAAYDGIYATEGAAEQSITEDWVRPLFRGETVNGYYPVDFTITTALRLQVYQNELWFQYQDTNGTRQVLCYHLTDKVWRFVTFSKAPNVIYTDTVPGSNVLIIGGLSTGKAYTYSGTSDDSVAISCTVRTGDLNQGYFKADKLYADYTVDANTNGVIVTATPYYNYSQSTATTLTVNTSTRTPTISSFLTEPLRAPTMALNYAWASATTAPFLYTTTLTFSVEPPTMTRWSSLPIDFGLGGWKLATAIYLCFRSTADLTVTVQSILQGADGNTTKTYTITSDSFEKRTAWLPLQASKGVLYYVQLSSTAPFIFYDDESYLVAQGWGTAETPLMHPFRSQKDGSAAESSLTAEAARTAGG